MVAPTQTMAGTLAMKKSIKQREFKGEDHLPSDLPPVLRRIYLTRGICHIDDLSFALENLPTFHDLLGIDKAVNCLYEALREQKKILIVGDYDADGATSSAVAIRALKSFGAKYISYLVPNRFDYGYGLSPEIVDVASEQKPDLLITVDNGISSVEGVARANQLGMQVIITDHHLPGQVLPDAAAIINPSQHHCPFPAKNIAGVGVIFYVMSALRAFLRERKWFAEQQVSEPNLAELLDLVALGTVADVVSLDSINRTLVQQGLRRIRKSLVCPGIAALIEVANRRSDTLVSQDFAFAIAPRLNAAGRLQDMSVGIECLLAEDEGRAHALAAQLDALNVERREIEAQMQEHATFILKNMPSQATPDSCICLYDATWHQGVIGILAGRLKEQFHRPTVIFAKGDDGLIKGSARSIAGIHIRDMFAEIAALHPQLIEKFGGHAMAAGLSIAESDFAKFNKAFKQTIDKYMKPEYLDCVVYTDGELTGDDLSLPFTQMLQRAMPWGQHCPEPLFEGSFTLIDQRIVGGKHLKLMLQHTTSQKNIDAIQFKTDLSRWPDYHCQEIKAVFRLDINEYKGVQRLQLIIDHIEPVEFTIAV